MNKLKSITKYITTYDRTNTYDDTIEEIKRIVSYVEYDILGNLCCDKTFDNQGFCENICKRIYDKNDFVIEENLFESEDDAPYESRKNSYDEHGLLIASHVTYSEEKLTEKFEYNQNGKLNEKKIVYPDGNAFVENKYVWENDLLIEECDFDDENSMNLRKRYFYDEKQRLITLEEHDFNQDNKVSETYQYNEFGMTNQRVLNFKGEVMINRTFLYNEDGLMIERVVESPNHFMRYVFEYNENKMPVKETAFNKDDLELTVKEILYNNDNEEVEMNVYSRNILEDIDELILIETYTTELEYF